jgi:hypothetical protein
MPTVRRTWIRKGNRHARVAVETLHPTCGLLLRGWICGLGPEAAGTGMAGRLTWALTDHDHTELDRVVGNYVDAEKALLDATTALEETA